MKNEPVKVGTLQVVRIKGKSDDEIIANLNAWFLENPNAKLFTDIAHDLPIRHHWVEKDEMGTVLSPEYRYIDLAFQD